MISKILVPLDGSKFAEKALPYAVELGQKFDAELLLVWVLHPLVVMYDIGATAYQEITTMEKETAVEYIAAQKAALEAQGVRVQAQVMEGPVAETLIDAACGTDVNLIVMTTHGRSGISRWMYGSVATKVLQHAPCPIFLVKPQDK